MSINRVCISGNLTKDPEVQMTTNGTQVMNFSVAVNDRRRNNQTGEWEDYPNFIDCVVFGARAESLSRILHKGFKCAIEGKLRQNKWEKDGQRRSRIEVIIDDIDFMQPRNQNGPGGYQTDTRPAPEPSQGYNQPPSPAPQPSYQDGYMQDDIPF